MELVTSPSGLSEASLLSRASRRTSQSSQRHLGVVEDGLQLFSIDGDRTHAICASAVGAQCPSFHWQIGSVAARPPLALMVITVWLAAAACSFLLPPFLLSDAWRASGNSNSTP